MATYSNSKLATYVRTAHQHGYYGLKTKPITKITIHHTAGVVSVEQLGEMFANPDRWACSNYGVGNDGRIGLYCMEAYAAGTSGSYDNDNQAVTIEVSNSMYGGNWPVSAKAYESLIKLCVDICSRNGIKKLNWTGDERGNLTVHRLFQATACVPTDTEVLTKNGWKQIKDIKIGEEIIAVDINDMSAKFSQVYDVVPSKLQETYRTRGIEATADHRMVCRNQYAKNYKCDSFENIMKPNSSVYIPCAAQYQGKGIDLTNDEIEFMIAVQADGHYMLDDSTNNPYGIEFHVKKERKIESIEDMLDRLGIEFTVCDKSDGSRSIRAYGKNIVDYAETWLKDKAFTWDWIELSPEQAKFFIDKLLDYDGCRAGNDYSSFNKNNIDIVDAIASLNNIGIRKNTDTRSCFTKSYRTITPHSDFVECGEKEVCCVSVPEGFILVRQNGRTTVIGNCPGDYLMSKMPDIAKEVNKRLEALEYDVDGDGKVTLKDATLLQKIVAKWKGIKYDKAKADVNHDGKINLADVTALMKFIAKGGK